MIGADLRRPALGDRFDSATGPGLGELLGGLYPFDECVQEVAGHEGLFMLHAGVLVTGTSPVDIFRTDDFGHLIEEVRPGSSIIF